MIARFSSFKLSEHSGPNNFIIQDPKLVFLHISTFSQEPNGNLKTFLRNERKNIGMRLGNKKRPRARQISWR